jgi:hypothetical protein
VNTTAVRYRCSNPGHPATAPALYDVMSPDGFCPDCHFGEGLLEAVSSAEAARAATEGARRHSGEIGLCVLACDVSGSMLSRCFPGNPASTLDLVARAAAAGISDLYALSNATDAYVVIIPFADRAAVLTENGRPFCRSISEIKAGYATGEELGAFLLSALPGAGVGGGTDFNQPLALAAQIRDQALQGSLGAYGGPEDFTVKTHDLIDIRSGQTVSVPNIRILLYSDGQHYGDIRNPFAAETHSPLLTMYFGEAETAGARQMRELACTCPQHGRPGFFLTDTPAAYATLRHLFRMASGASGFCPECSRAERSEYERAAA